MCMCVRGVQKGVKTIENDASQIIKHSMRYKSQTLYNIKTQIGRGWVGVDGGGASRRTIKWHGANNLIYFLRATLF